MTEAGGPLVARKDAGGPFLPALANAGVRDLHRGRIAQASLPRAKILTCYRTHNRCRKSGLAEGNVDHSDVGCEFRNKAHAYEGAPGRLSAYRPTKGAGLQPAVRGSRGSNPNVHLLIARLNCVTQRAPGGPPATSTAKSRSFTTPFKACSRPPRVSTSLDANGLPRTPTSVSSPTSTRDGRTARTQTHSARRASAPCRARSTPESTASTDWLPSSRRAPSR